MAASTFIAHLSLINQTFISDQDKSISLIDGIPLVGNYFPAQYQGIMYFHDLTDNHCYITDRVLEVSTV
jgi:hypothetical protein